MLRDLAAGSPPSRLSSPDDARRSSDVGADAHESCLPFLTLDVITDSVSLQEAAVVTTGVREDPEPGVGESGLPFISPTALFYEDEPAQNGR